VNESFLDILKRHKMVDASSKGTKLSQALEELSFSVAGVLGPCPPEAGFALLTHFVSHVRALAGLKEIPASQNCISGLPPAALSGEFLEWALAQTSEVEIVAGLREIEETGGISSTELLRDLDQRVWL
jgi:hypothetical protein